MIENLNTIQEKVNVIYGPPGCGKTYHLLEKIEHFIKNGVSPTSIMFISFTRKATNEAKDRAARNLNLNELQLQWFKTMHGLAFHQLGLGKENVISIKDYFKIFGELGLFITNRGYGEDGIFTGQTRGDRLLFMENMSRTMMIDLKEFWSMFPNEDIDWFELDLVKRSLDEYKQTSGKKDFTDMVMQYCDSPVLPDIKILFIDEAQDLSPLQWKMAEILIDHAEETYVAGDDDQSIFRWAGANTEKFINISGVRTVLPQSFRVPIKVQEIAETITSRLTNRVGKKWSPRDFPGKIERINGLDDELDMSSETWLLMARNIHLLDDYVRHCISNGYLFDGENSPIRNSVFKAIVDWNRLTNGESINNESVENLYDYISSGSGIARGFKKMATQISKSVLYTFGDLTLTYGLLLNKTLTWDKALDRITDEEREYFLAALKKGEKLTNKPRIKIATIHSSKGGEADNVVICVDMAPRTWEEYQLNQDDEHRVWYVAVTRARKSLYILTPKSNMYYDI